MSPPSGKQCSRCKRVLPASAFTRRVELKDGLQAWCKECLRESKKPGAKKRPGTPGRQPRRAVPGRELSEADFERLYQDMLAEAKEGDVKSRDKLLAMHQQALAGKPASDPHAIQQERADLLIRGLREMWRLNPEGFVADGCEYLETVGAMGLEEAARQLGMDLPDA